MIYALDLMSSKAMLSLYENEQDEHSAKYLLL